ncbi:hypothetical protein ACI2LF_23940 [Kribbella sp. NPDC020789]
MASPRDETTTLAASLYRHLHPLRLSGLTAVQATRLVTSETARWATAQGWMVAYEAWGQLTRMTQAGPRRARLDLVCTRPAQQPAVAIEIDKHGKVWSLQKLQAEAQAGRVALWVRWNGRTEIEIPESVGLVDIHEGADYRPSEQAPHSRISADSPADRRHSPSTPESLLSAPERERLPDLPSPDDIEAARTAAGGFTRAQLAAWGVTWPPPKGWKKDLNDRWHTARREPET